MIESEKPLETNEAEMGNPLFFLQEPENWIELFVCFIKINRQDKSGYKNDGEVAKWEKHENKTDTIQVR